MKPLKIVSFIVVIGLTCYVAYFSIRRNTLAPNMVRDNAALIVGTTDDYPPYSFNKDGVIVGFDIDIIKELAHRMAQKIEIKNMSFDVLLLELENGCLQVAAAGVEPSQERNKRFFFTTPHLNSEQFIAVTLKDSVPINSIEDMKDKIVIVNDGYTTDTFMSAQKGIVLRRLENVAQAMLALEKKKADVFVTINSSVQPYFKEHAKEAFRITELSEGSLGIAFAVSKKFPDLYKRLEGTLLELREDGTIDDIKRRWGL